MPREKRTGARSLAGTNGIPLPAERRYLHVVAETDERGEMRPLEVVWRDGRRFRVASARVLRRYGRWELGTLAIAYEASFARRNRADAHRLLWWEHGRWFTRASTAGTAGTARPGEPAPPPRA